MYDFCPVDPWIFLGSKIAKCSVGLLNLNFRLFPVKMGSSLVQTGTTWLLRSNSRTCVLGHAFLIFDLSEHGSVIHLHCGGGTYSCSGDYCNDESLVVHLDGFFIGVTLIAIALLLVLPACIVFCICIHMRSKRREGRIHQQGQLQQQQQQQQQQLSVTTLY